MWVCTSNHKSFTGLGSVGGKNGTWTDFSLSVGGRETTNRVCLSSGNGMLKNTAELAPAVDVKWPYPFVEKFILAHHGYTCDQGPFSAENDWKDATGGGVQILRGAVRTASAPEVGTHQTWRGMGKRRTSMTRVFHNFPWNFPHRGNCLHTALPNCA